MEDTAVPFTCAYVGSVVPDEPRYRTAAFNRAGNRSQFELLKGLTQAGMPPSLSLSFLPIPAFPRSRRLIAGPSRLRLANGTVVQLLPFLNILGLKQLTIGLAAFGRLLWWSLRNVRQPRVICCFNLTVPPGPFLWLAARLSGARLVSFLNDLNIPGQTAPDRWPHRLDFAAQRWLIPRLDGRTCVSDAFVTELAPGRHYIRVDGGVTAELAETMSRHVRHRSGGQGSPGADFTVVSVGRIDETNGFAILLAALRLLPAGGVRIVVAGRGPLGKRVEELAARDSRLEYRGFLTHEEVLAVYGEADLLLNLRITRGLNTRYFFPSKLIEYLVSGVPVLSTAPAHVREEYAPYVYLLDDETPEGLARAIEHVRGEPATARTARAESARAYMLENKLWHHQAARIRDYLRDEVLS